MMNESEKFTLGVVAICKNEEQDLPGFIENLRSWVNEIIVVDDASTDASRAILLNAAPKVKLLEHKMTPEGGFAGQRNHGIMEARSDWLLHMDIDERVTPELASEIKEAIQNTSNHAFRYRRLNFFLHRPMKGGIFRDWNNPQLARQGYHYFENSVHETCVIEGGPAFIGQLQARMWHLNDASYLERMQKSMVYCQYAAKKLIEKRVKVRWRHFVMLPMVEFIRQFVFKRGYIDRTPGFLFSLHASCAMFKACALVWG